jgi:hypothetical protein
MASYTLGEEAIRQISALVRQEAQRAVRTHTRQDRRSVLTVPIYLAYTPAGGIAALSGDTPGSAECTIKFINADGDVETAKDSDGDDVKQTVYNVASSAVAGETLIQCKQECIGGALLVDFEDCG